MKEIDIPPLWLGVALLASWALGQVWSAPGFGAIGAVVMLAGACLMGVALVHMRLLRTSFIPRRDPTALASTGVFALSRNPIYLADAIILTGAILYWGAVLALPLVPLFGLWITRRFVLDEEARLRRAFGAGYDDWAAQVPRWFWRI